MICLVIEGGADQVGIEEVDSAYEAERSYLGATCEVLALAQHVPGQG